MDKFRLEDHNKYMEKFSQNLVRLSLSLVFLTVPASALFIGYEYLSYKKGIADYAEKISVKYEKLLEKMKEINPELDYYLDWKDQAKFLT